MSEWISVEDRLPESDGRYIVFVPDGCDCGDCSYIATFECDHISPVDGHIGWRTQQPSHWMPLPDPPRRG
jgi:hypothetical protein